MKATCEKKELLKIINYVARAVSAKAVSPIMECMVMEAEGGRIALKGTDTVLSIKSSVDANVSEEGRIAVNARLFSDIINKYPDGELSIETDESKLYIKCLKTKAQLKFADAAEYPEFPGINRENAVELEESALRQMINQTIFSTAITDDKPILTGVLFELEEGRLSLIALDGYRMAIRSTQIAASKSVSAVIPAKSLRELSRILSESEQKLKLYISEKSVSVEAGDTEIHTRLLEGEYVKYKNFLPADYKTRVKIDTALLEQAIDRASVMSREDSYNLIRLSINESMVVITSNSEFGNSYEEIPAYTEGNELTIAFNAKYISDVIKNISDNELVADFNTSLSPCLIHPECGESYFYLVLPVQLRS